MLIGTTAIEPARSYRKMIGAGGWVTGVDQAADGTLFTRCDTTLPYYRNPGALEWTVAVTPGINFPGSLVQGGCSIFAAAICWGNSAVRAFTNNDKLYVMKPGATQWNLTTLPPRSMNGNSDVRMCGQPLQFDPANPNVLWIGQTEGVSYTTDCGDTWTQIPLSTLPAPVTVTVSGRLNVARHSIRFDHTSPVVDGKTQRIYIFVPGSGVYVSNNAGSTWNLMVGSPISCSSMKISRINGNILVGGDNREIGGTMWLFDGTSWNESKGPDNTSLIVQAVEFHNSDPNIAWGVNPGGGVTTSNNGAVSFGAYGGQMQTPATVDISWHDRQGRGASGIDHRSIGEAVHNVHDDYLYMSAGIGFWVARTPPTQSYAFPAPKVLVHGTAAGIENMVGTVMTVSPDGKCGLTMQDKQLMLFSASGIGEKFTLNYGPRVGQIIRGTTCDYAPEDTDFWVGTIEDAGNPAENIQGYHCGYTTDLGASWTLSSSLLDMTGGLAGGQIVVLSKDIWVASQFSGYTINATRKVQNSLYLTRDRGQTWTMITGIGNDNAVSSHFGSNASRISMCKDYTIPGRMYFYNTGDFNNPDSADTLACQGFYQIDVPMTGNGAPTVTRKRTDRVFAAPFWADMYHLKLRHGGAANTLVCTAGNNGVLGCFRSTDGGSNWTQLTGTDNLGMGTRFGEVDSISVGKAHWTSSNPTIWVIGYRITDDYYDNGQDFSKYGEWESRDNGATWTRTAQFPGQAWPQSGDGNFSVYNDHCAGMHEYGYRNVSTNGSGAVHIGHHYKLAAT